MPVATPKRKRAKKPKKPVSYDLIQRERLKGKISRITCSPWWTDHALATCERYGVPPESKHVASALSLYHIYPPPAENTPMKSCRCKRCQGVRMWPAYYIRSSGVSTECAYEAMSKEIVSKLEGSVSSTRMLRGGKRGNL